MPHCVQRAVICVSREICEKELRVLVYGTLSLSFQWLAVGCVHEIC